MANHIITDYTTLQPTVAEVLAEFETKLETLDSTNNPIRLIEVYPEPDGQFKGVILYTDT